MINIRIKTTDTINEFYKLLDRFNELYVIVSNQVKELHTFDDKEKQLYQEFRHTLWNKIEDTCENIFNEYRKKKMGIIDTIFNPNKYDKIIKKVEKHKLDCELMVDTIRYRNNDGSLTDLRDNMLFDIQKINTVQNDIVSLNFDDSSRISKFSLIISGIVSITSILIAYYSYNISCQSYKSSNDWQNKQIPVLQNIKDNTASTNILINKYGSKIKSK